MGSLRNGAIRARILLWGPPGAGKTTTLKHVGSKLKTNQKGDIQKVTLKNPPCNYELLPVELGDVKGVPTKLDFQSCPGAWEHVSVRKRLLQGIDGVVFIANSIGSAMKDNQRSLAELEATLKGMGRSLVTVPVVFQWMNHKAIGSIPSDEMQAKLNKVGAQTFLVPAEDPSGMLKAFAAISKMAVKVVRDDYDAGKLVEPAPMDLDLDSLPPPPAVQVEVEDELPPSLTEFEDLAGDLADDLGEADFGANTLADEPEDAEEGTPEPAMAVPGDDELDALLDSGGGKPAPVQAVSSSGAELRPARSGQSDFRANGSAKFRLVAAGEPTLSADGTLALPVRIGNEHGEEVALTISVKVIPD